MTLAAAAALSLWPVPVHAQPATPADTPRRPIVAMQTSLGDIHLEVLIDEAPATAAHFLAHLDAGYYDETTFHRVLPTMIQGGRYTTEGKVRARQVDLVNEAPNTRSNQRGTVAAVHAPGLAHVATVDFFINVTDNPHLDHRNLTPSGYGWAVFARVVSGMDVVDAIAAGSAGGAPEPRRPVVILSMRRGARPAVREAE